jgi:hypothetical protein
MLLRGTDGITSPSKEVKLWVLSPLKIRHPQLGLNRWTLGPIASAVTTRPLRATCGGMRSVFYIWGRGTWNLAVTGKAPKTFRLSGWQVWRWLSCGMFHHIVWSDIDQCSHADGGVSKVLWNVSQCVLSHVAQHFSRHSHLHPGVLIISKSICPVYHC